MQMVTMTPGDGPDVRLTGTVLTIGGHEVDLAQVQSDVEVILAYSWALNGRVLEGVRPDRAYAAQVIVPPTEYEERPTGEADPETGAPVVELVRLPLDTDAVRVLTWARP